MSKECQSIAKTKFMRIKPPECRTLRTAASNLRSLRDVAPKEHQQDEEGNGQAGPLGILRVQNPPSLVPHSSQSVNLKNPGKNKIGM